MNYRKRMTVKIMTSLDNWDAKMWRTAGVMALALSAALMVMAFLVSRLGFGDVLTFAFVVLGLVPGLVCLVCIAVSIIVGDQSRDNSAMETFNRQVQALQDPR